MKCLEHLYPLSFSAVCFLVSRSCFGCDVIVLRAVFNPTACTDNFGYLFATDTQD